MAAAARNTLKKTGSTAKRSIAKLQAERVRAVLAEMDEEAGPVSQAVKRHVQKKWPAR